jgi:hypothetical protein
MCINCSIIEVLVDETIEPSDCNQIVTFKEDVFTAADNQDWDGQGWASLSLQLPVDFVCGSTA